MVIQRICIYICLYLWEEFCYTFNVITEYKGTYSVNDYLGEAENKSMNYLVKFFDLYIFTQMNFPEMLTRTEIRIFFECLFFLGGGGTLDHGIVLNKK